MKKICFLFKVLYLLYTLHKYRRYWSNRHLTKGDDIFVTRIVNFSLILRLILLFFSFFSLRQKSVQKRVIFGHLWGWMDFFGFEQKFSKPKIFPRKSLGPAFYLDLKKGKIAIFQNFAKIPKENLVGEKIEKIYFFFKVLHLLYTSHKYRRHWPKSH